MLQRAGALSPRGVVIDIAFPNMKKRDEFGTQYAAVLCTFEVGKIAREAMHSTFLDDLVEKVVSCQKSLKGGATVSGILNQLTRARNGLIRGWPPSWSR